MGTISIGPCCGVVLINHAEYNVSLQHCSETANRSVLLKKMFLKISQNSHEHTCFGISFSAKLLAVIKKKPQHRCFTVNIAKFLRTPILKNIRERLLLPIVEFFS